MIELMSYSPRTNLLQGEAGLVRYGGSVEKLKREIESLHI